MKILTLIPNSSTYGLLVLNLLILGSFTIARQLHLRVLKAYFSFIASNALVKSVIVCMGLFIFPLMDLFPMPVMVELKNLIIGVGLGVIVLYAEIKLLRLSARRMPTPYNNMLTTENTIFRNVSLKQHLKFTSTSISAMGLNVRHYYDRYIEANHFIGYSLIAVIIVAIAEECLFRGYFFLTSKLFVSITLQVFFLLWVTLLFAASHLSHHWKEGVRKLPLALLTMLGLFVTNSLITPIGTHLTLNIYAYHLMKRLTSKS